MQKEYTEAISGDQPEESVNPVDSQTVEQIHYQVSYHDFLQYIDLRNKEGTKGQTYR
jgi:hypothetical protein